MPYFVDTLIAGQQRPDEATRLRRQKFTLALLEALDECAVHGMPATLFINACTPYGLRPPDAERFLAELTGQGLIAACEGTLKITLAGQHQRARLAAHLS